MNKLILSYISTSSNNHASSLNSAVVNLPKTTLDEAIDEVNAKYGEILKRLKG